MADLPSSSRLITWNRITSRPPLAVKRFSQRMLFFVSIRFRFCFFFFFFFFFFFHSWVDEFVCSTTTTTTSPSVRPPNESAQSAVRVVRIEKQARTTDARDKSKKERKKERKTKTMKREEWNGMVRGSALAPWRRHQPTQGSCMQTSGRGRKGGRQTVKWEERVQFKRPIQNTIRRNLLARGQWRVPTRLHLNTQRRSRLENPNPNKRKTLFGRVLLIGWIRPETTGLKNEIDVNVHRKKKKKRKKVDWSWLGGSSLHLRHGVFPTARQWPSLSLLQLPYRLRRGVTPRKEKEKKEKENKRGRRRRRRRRRKRGWRMRSGTSTVDVLYSSARRRARLFFPPFSFQYTSLQKPFSMKGPALSLSLL